MKLLLTSRRTFLTFWITICVTGLGLHLHTDVTSQLVMLGMALIGGNAAEGVMTARTKDGPAR